MNRLLICIILLLGSQAAVAEKLYRWVEPDGAITFSPIPPPEGTDFETVDSITSETAANDEITPAKAAKPSILATSEHDIAKPLIPVSEETLPAATTAEAAKQGLNYAPDTAPAGITRSEPRVSAAAPVNDDSQTAEPQTIASSTKRKQCEDLSKRVMSLERRLRSDLEWDDMDNTVIAMARYQTSYDKHCAA